MQLYEHLDKEMRKKKIREQFTNTTMKLAERLARYEFQGVRVDLKKLERLRNDLLDGTAVMKERIWEDFGKKMDLDSHELTSAIKDHLNLAREIGAKTLSLRLLEELAIPHQDVRRIVDYKRRRKQLKRIESIAAAAKENKVYPLFNQVRSSSGRLSSSDPRLFEDAGLDLVRSCFSPVLREFFPTRRRALDHLATESEDRQLKSDRSQRRRGNKFMAKHPTMKRLDHDEFLLSVICGESGPAMSRRFTLERMDFESACHDVKVRYNKLFEWLSRYREEAAKRGYVTGPRGRKYLAGLKSSSIEKRKKAADACVRWYIGW